MSKYNIVVSENQSTVVAEYVPYKNRSGSYQSEAELERFVEFGQGFVSMNILILKTNRLLLKIYAIILNY